MKRRILEVRTASGTTIFRPQEKRLFRWRNCTFGGSDAPIYYLELENAKRHWGPMPPDEQVVAIHFEHDPDCNHTYERTGKFSGKGVGEQGICSKCGHEINLPL